MFASNLTRRSLAGGAEAAVAAGAAFADYSKPANQPVRWLADGGAASATIDAANGGFGKNDGDNEITGVHVSNGDPSPSGILGAALPNLFHDGWRWFYTRQNGENATYEVIPSPRYGATPEHDRKGDGKRR